MKSKNLSQSIKILFILLAISLPVASVFAHGLNIEKSRTSPLPSGYSKYIVFLGDGVYQSVDGSIMTGGIANANEPGLEFQRNIMNRSEDEIATQRQKALDFFQERFGFNGENDPDILFTAYEVNPKNEIHAVTVSHEKVPRKGWFVHDGGFMALVINPAGTTLGGEFSGIHVPANTSVVFGEYKVMRAGDGKDNNKNNEDTFVIRYRSKEPLAFTQFGSVVRCELDNDDYGPGFNGGMFGPVQLGDGFLQPNIKSVLTFPPLGPNNQHNQDRF